MTKKGIDCAVPLNANKAQAIRKAGYDFVCRYLVPASYAWKRLTRAEAELITAAGMQIISVFQRGANDAAGGAVNGTRDGKAAYQEAKAIGQPVGTTIYFAVDYDAQPIDYDKISAYLQAADRELPGYQIGVYGSFAVVEVMVKRLSSIRVWQTYAWSRGSKSAKANIYQHKNDVMLAGHNVDLNESYGGEGWWNTNSVKEEPSMSVEDADKIIAIIQAQYGIVAKLEGAKVANTLKEFGRLADEVRIASGRPSVNARQG